MKWFVVAAALACACACAPEAAQSPAAPTAIELTPITYQESGGLNGELGCAFSVGDDMLLLAMGIVASQQPSEAAVKVGDSVRRLTASAPGGFDTLVDGESFAADGLTVEVRTNAAQETGHEGSAYNATLIVRDGAGVSRSYEGVWGCGP